jgi:protein-disulfide isomerase/uncharacterized membrane protein
MRDRHRFWLLFSLTSLGLLFSLRLLWLDYTVLTGSGASAECNLNATFNCSAVARSSYAFLAGIPVAAWGLLGYALVLAYLGLNLKRDPRLPLLGVYSFFSVISLYYFAVTKLQLQVICLYCLFTYLINWGSTLLLFFFCRQSPRPRLLANLGLLPVPIIAYFLLSVVILTPAYFGFRELGPAQAHALSASPVKPLGPVYPLGKFDSQRLVASAGDPQGAVKLEVFSDYQCPFCAQFETVLQQAMQEFENIQLARKEFPLDRNCNRLMGNNQLHPFACQAAYFAKCAGLQGQFWQAAEQLHLQHESFAPEFWPALAQTLKLKPAELQSCMQTPAIHDAVLAEIQEGLFKGVNSTPAYFINGEKQSGVLPYPEFKQLLLKAGGKLKQANKMGKP